MLKHFPKRMRLAALLAALAGPVALAAPPVEDFCFLQVSDIHLNPHPAGADAPKPGDRSVDTIAWVCEEAKKPQTLAPVRLIAPPPAFVIATGDLTEYGVIHETWNDFERLFAPLGVPLYVAPGNHDNTWTSMLHIMRRRHGGDHYAFDRFGCHFVAIDTATPQEPVPTIEARTLHWLRSDLHNVEPDTPVFIFCHHPLSSGEFAKPYEQLRLLDAIAGHNVVLLLMGHGHGVRHERWGTLDGVMGGSTFGPNTGYSIISVTDDMLRVVYRYREDGKPVQPLLEKPIQAPQRPEIWLHFPMSRFDTEFVTAGHVNPLVKTERGDVRSCVLTVNDDPERRVRLAAEDAQVKGASARYYSAQLSLKGLPPGRHFVRATVDFGDVTLDTSGVFRHDPRHGRADWTPWILSAGMKARPLVTEAGVIVATTAGDLHLLTPPASQPTGWAGRFRPAHGDVKTLFSTGAEILSTPAFVDGTLYCGSGDMAVYALAPDGTQIWKCQLGATAYGTPAVDDERVYVGDLEGSVHALDRKTGKIIWSTRHATYSIEQSLVLHDGVLYFGAWDGFLYAVNAQDGSLAWKQGGPASYREDRKFRSRYYAPADCSPVIIGDRIFVADRAYAFGSYHLKGQYMGEIAADVSAVGLSEDGRSVYTRGLEKGLTRYDAEGRQVWTNPVTLGRFPVPPTEAAGKVYVCSNHGLLTVHDAADGKTLWRYQVTPQLPVMAPVAVDTEGHVYVTGMDGTVTRVRVDKK